MACNIGSVVLFSYLRIIRKGDSMKRFLMFSLALLVGLTSYAMGSKDVAPAAKPLIAVSILPQGYFVQRISGGAVDYTVLVGPGQDPHSYEPTPSQMADLSKAKAWILSNTDFELALRPKIQSLYPSLSLVDGTDGVIFRKMEAHTHEGEAAPAVPATGMEIDRHTWLGRAPARIMATHIKDTLVKIDPKNASAYEANCKALIADIDREFDALIPRLAALKGTTVFVFHPAFGYFLDEFGIEQESVETGGKEPTAQTLAKLVEEARKDKVRAIFVQSQFPVSAAKTLADAVGAKVLPLDPLAPDWLANIKRMGETLIQAAQ